MKLTLYSDAIYLDDTLTLNSLEAEGSAEYRLNYSSVRIENFEVFLTNEKRLQPLPLKSALEVFKNLEYNGQALRNLVSVDIGVYLVPIDGRIRFLDYMKVDHRREPPTPRNTVDPETIRKSGPQVLGIAEVKDKLLGT